MTLEARLDMPTEETSLLQEEKASTEVSSRTKKVAGGVLTLFALAAVASADGTAMRPIPSSFKDFQDHMPTYSFLLSVLIHAVREFLHPDWAMGPALQLYTFALPYVIMVQAAGQSGWGGYVTQVGVAVGVVATVLDQLKGAEQPSYQRIVNCACSGLVVAGTLKAVIDRTEHIMDALPFLGWAVTACCGVLSVFLQTGGVGGIGQSLWLLVLYTAAQASSAGSGLDADLLKVACLAGAVYSLLNFLDLLGEWIQDVVYAVATAAIFVPLAWNTIKNTKDFETVYKHVATYSFAVILGVRAVYSILALILRDGKYNANAITGDYVWLFVLCLVLHLRTLLSMGSGSSDFSKYAAQMAQFGPLIGLVVLILDLVQLFPELLKKLRHLAELITALGILLA